MQPTCLVSAVHPHGAQDVRTVFPPLQVVLSSACSVASLSRCPNHYLPGHPHLRGDALADYVFGKGNPSTWRAGRTPPHETPPDGRPNVRITLPRWHTQCTQAQLPQQRINANGARGQPTQKRKTVACSDDVAQLHPTRTPTQDRCEHTAVTHDHKQNCAARRPCHVDSPT